MSESGQLVEIAVGDDAESWRAAGFTVVDDSIVAGETTIRLLGSKGERGLRGWRLAGISDSLDGLPTLDAGEGTEGARDPHPNTAVAIDHVVAGSDDLERTTRALAEHGIDLRRTRDFAREGVARQQRFFWLGSVILELMGRVEAKPDARGPAKLWGLAFTVADIHETCRVLGERTSEHRTAIQPDRRISTLRGEPLGISIPVAFMTPHVTASAPDN